VVRGVQDHFAMNTTSKRLGGAMDPDERLRHEWAESLAEHMAEQDVTVKKLRALLVELGPQYEVSRQGIESWLKGATSPRPHMQAALGTVLNVPARRLFPIENVRRVSEQVA
jgi:hypothetical protein